MKNQWIVVANASLARIFRRDSPLGPVIPVESMTHERSRMHASELATERPDGEGAVRDHTDDRFEPRDDLRRKEHLHFARELADRLERGLANHEYDSLALFASNPFLGELRPQLSEGVDKKIRSALDHDFTSLSLAEIEERLKELHAARP